MTVATGYDKATLIYVAHHTPSSQPVVVRRTNLDVLSQDQLETIEVMRHVGLVTISRCLFICKLATVEIEVQKEEISFVNFQFIKVCS